MAAIALRWRFSSIELTSATRNVHQVYNFPSMLSLGEISSGMFLALTRLMLKVLSQPFIRRAGGMCDIS